MINIRRTFVTIGWFIGFFLGMLGTAVGQGKVPMKYTVSMDHPDTHYFHLQSQYQLNKTKDTVTFNMPAWTPGYYWIEDYPKNVTRFTVTDEDGHNLSWHKTTKNSWQIDTEGAQTILIQYDVYAHNISVADPYLDNNYGFISPAGLFMWPKGELEHPVNVTIKPYKDWDTISTGLTLVDKAQNKFSASDFDQLYDSPFLIGNQKVTVFDVKGVPHYLAILHPENFDIPKLVNDLKKIIVAATGMIGEVPYDDYTFLVMGQGRGGLEHFNSAAVFSNNQVYNPDDKEEYSRWLGFLAHEYFHNFNVKRIRPIALGPFDYSKENYTRMLWVAEGFTVYYQYMLLNRAGLINSQEFLDRVRENIRHYEWIPGHNFQSATQSSFNTWIQFFNHGPDSENRTISYYDKGCVLGMLMDLKIRHVTDGKKSLDDVMRLLYHRYYKTKNRGYTDSEFREVSEEVAGTSLDDIFRYASTTDDIDYQKYLAYAGLKIDTTSHVQKGGYLGAKVSEESGRLKVSGIVRNSPAWNSKLSSGATILQISGEAATMDRWNDLTVSSKPGDRVDLVTTRDGQNRHIELTFGSHKQRSFNISKMANPSAEQQQILSGWLGN